MRKLGISLGVILLLVAAGLAWVRSDRPDLAAYDAYLVPVGQTGAGVHVTFLGVSTLLITDGETALMTDGFFTRPSLVRSLLGSIEPDRETISRILRRAGVDRLDAVIVVHSHYDHAMDAPEVAIQTGALLLGSESTANVGRGWGLPESRIRVPGSGEPMRFGRFQVTLVSSRHLPHGLAMGEISEPLIPPAHSMSYLAGATYSVHIAHPLGSLLVQGSAGWIDGALEAYPAGVVLLGVGGLSRMDEAYRAGYFREVVEAVGARRIFPVHHDDFTLPLEAPLRALPRLIGDFGVSMAFLEARAAADPGLELALLPLWQPVLLFPQHP